MYAGYPCKFCGRQRVEEEGDKHICEKCRRDQETGEYVPEPDLLDELTIANIDPVENPPHHACRGTNTCDCPDCAKNFPAISPKPD